MKTLRSIFVALTLLALFAVARPALAQTAQASRTGIVILTVGINLNHTYSYYSGYGWECYYGTCSGAVETRSTSSIWGNEATCMANSMNLTYGITGVCHQATNRGMADTAIPWVRNWGTVAGAGLSYNLYCDYGSSAWTGACYSQPC